MSHLEDQKMARKVAQLVAEKGGRTFYVGGFVRDALIHRENKDVDIEVHGITPRELEGILDSLGQRLAMGESFGIFGLKGYSLDIAMPRKEAARGQGHKDFDIFVDPFIGTQAAARRRDFTFNALMQDVLTGEIVDHFGGVEDLKAGVLRHVNDESFAEDPLRVLRAAQFAARFGFRVAEQTVSLCSGMQLQHLPRERIEGELKKALLKAERPSIFFEVLRKMEQLDHWFPELKALVGVKQNPVYHSEGDVWTHTMMVLDEAAKLRDHASNPYWFMLSAVTHDFGKAVCTEEHDGVLHAYQHEIKGLPLAETFLRRITSETKLIEYVLNMVEYHMKPNTVAGARSAKKVTTRMFDQSVDPEGLICIALADDRGRITQTPATDHEAFLYERLEVFKELMTRPYVMGRDLIEAGLKPGVEFTEILEYAHKLRLAGVAKDSAMKQTLAYARQVYEK
ncbi:MAG: tRNA nucleotidyltransferase [Oscillospiraceae bacterium]|nr:tRNA nucleotidyltransferase [Oscillospiraceae bacterium]